MNNPTAHADDFCGLPLAHEKVTKYDWRTRVRVTTDGVTISNVIDVLDVPIDGFWGNDHHGRFFVQATQEHDVRHCAVQRFDERVWGIILGDHSPKDEVHHAPYGATADSIANDLMAEYPDSVTMASNLMQVEVRDVLRSLARTLRFEGGANS
jgi:hypothetical protein